MPIRALSWRIRAGELQPRPLIEDDSARFPGETVRLVREWLGTLVAAHINAPPTPQLIQLSRPELGPHATTNQVMRALRKTISFDGVNPTRVDGVIWQAGTAMILRKGPGGVIVAKHEYVIARSVFSGLHICGPELRDATVARDAAIEVM